MALTTTTKFQIYICSQDLPPDLQKFIYSILYLIPTCLKGDTNSICLKKHISIPQPRSCFPIDFSVSVTGKLKPFYTRRIKTERIILDSGFSHTLYPISEQAVLPLPTQYSQNSDHFSLSLLLLLSQNYYSFLTWVIAMTLLQFPCFYIFPPVFFPPLNRAAPSDAKKREFISVPT